MEWYSFTCLCVFSLEFNKTKTTTTTQLVMKSFCMAEKCYCLLQRNTGVILETPSMNAKQISKNILLQNKASKTMTPRVYLFLLLLFSSILNSRGFRPLCNNFNEVHHFRPLTSNRGSDGLFISSLFDLDIPVMITIQGWSGEPNSARSAHKAQYAYDGKGCQIIWF